MKVRFIFGIFLCCLVISVNFANGQSALDGFDPNANGTIRKIVVQSDGKILVGGQFTEIGGQSRTGIARLNADGTLDTAFNPNANGDVYSIAVQSDGQIIVGGDFTMIGSQMRNRLARLEGITGNPDLSFDPNADGRVVSISVQQDGRILAGGEFNSIGGEARNYIARINANGGLDSSFNPNANSPVRVIDVQNGIILAGGSFTAIGGQVRNRLAQLDSVTGAADVVFNPNASGSVSAIAWQADGKIIVGGDFQTIGGQFRPYIARLNQSGVVDTGFDANADDSVYSVAVQTDGRILAGGNFLHLGSQSRSRIARLNPANGNADLFDPQASGIVYAIACEMSGKIIIGGNYSGIGGIPRGNITRLEANGMLDKSLSINPVSDGFVAATAVQPDGKIIIGGFFKSILGVSRNSIARLNADGTLDTAFNPGVNENVYAITLQSDGKILIGGNFTSVNGETRKYIARLDASGNLDSWNPMSNDAVLSIVVQSDGKILVGGGFSGTNSIGGANRNRIARLDPVTALADSFNPNANNQVLSIAIEADGRILIGGAFSTVGGQSRNYISRLNPVTGAVDFSLNTDADSTVIAIAVQPDGKILIGGNFTRINGSGLLRMARLNPNGSFDFSFSPRANAGVMSIALQADGKILVAGNFNGTNSIGGANRNYIARLNQNGTADSTFDPNADAALNTVSLLPDGKVLAGGHFTNIGNQPRSYLARLSNNTAVFSSLTVTPNTVSWTTDGAGPQLSRVIFEFSTDGQNYVFLGNGTGAASATNGSRNNEPSIAPASFTWTLTNLNLPAGQNIYIRARGYYFAGYHNGSESITETVKNAFLIVPTVSGASIAGRVLSSQGAGLAKASVRLMNSQGQIRTATSNSFGFYRFDNVPASETYIFNVSAKGYQFAPHIMIVNQDIEDLTFLALENQ